MKKSGEISVFLSLCILCIAALLCVMAESVRMSGSRYYFQTAVGGALDSLFSRYHRNLWKQYRVLGLPCGSRREAEDRLRAYTEKYLEAENWYPVRLESVEITEQAGLLDQGGDYLVQEILDYMKFGVWGNLEITPDGGGQFLKDLREAAGAGEMADAYQEQAGEVRKLELAVEKIAECADRQEKYAEEIARMLASDDAGGFRAGAAAFRREESRMDRLVENYEKQADRLKKRMEGTRKEMAASSETWQENRAALFAEQMNPFDAYVEEDGARRQEIMEQLAAGKENVKLLEQTEQLVAEAQAVLKEQQEAYRMYREQQAAGGAEPGREQQAAGGAGPEREQREVGGAEQRQEREEPRLSLREAEKCWNGYIRSIVKLKRGEGDQEKEGFLERVRELARGGLLELVLPKDDQVSSAAIPAETFSSKRASGESGSVTGPVERVLLHEYCGHFFTNACSKEKKPVQYEMEYLLHGRDNDRANLEDTMKQLLLVRQGLNLIQILSDPAKRNEAHGLAAGIAGVTGLAPLAEVMACLIMCIWAAGEALLDLRILYDGGKVPLWKSAEEWNLSLEGLLDMGRTGTCPENKGSGRGYAYVTYLKLLLFLTEDQKLKLRIPDMMELNLKRQEAAFSMEKCVYRMAITGKASGNHVFFRLPFVENYVGAAEEYPLEAPAARAY